MLLFFAIWLKPREIWWASWHTLAVVAGLFALALLYGWGVAEATEFHNDTVRRRIEASLGLRRRVSNAVSLP
jgi:hypothetical protein